MDEEPEKSHQEEHPQAGDGEAMPAEQRAALQKGQGGMDEVEAEVGEGILDHAEHSDAPGPHGTS